VPLERCDQLDEVVLPATRFWLHVRSVASAEAPRDRAR
jgi:hypothetical protein